MRLQIYDPAPFQNEYVSKMYFSPMLRYAADYGIDCTLSDYLVPTTGGGVICNADYLTPETIRHFRDNDYRMFGFSCIDSAYLAESLRYAPEAELVTKLFMVSGVQHTNISNATVIDGQFNITAEPRRFLPDENWAVFDRMRQEGRLQSLPYVPWRPLNPPARLPFDQRHPGLIFRGGNHFFRVLAYFVAVSLGIADPLSGFRVRDYFRADMNPQFRFCQDCLRVMQTTGRFGYPGDLDRGECNSPAPWGSDLDLSVTGLWNNRCPKSFYWLAREFSKRHGMVDPDTLVNALNFDGDSEDVHLANIGRCRFYADSKWEFSINAAQRFWEGASVGTVNLLPRRAADQDYFPVMREGEHYLTFSDDFSDISNEIERDRFERISQNAFELWEQWIKPTDYAISTNLLRHIFGQILC